MPRLVGRLDGYAVCATLRGVISEFMQRKADRSLCIHEDAVAEMLHEVGRQYSAIELPGAMKAAGVESFFSDWDARVPTALARRPAGEEPSEDWDAMMPQPVRTPLHAEPLIFDQYEWAR